MLAMIKSKSNTSYSEELQSLIDEKGLVQNAVCQALDISPAALSQYLNNKYIADTKKIDKKVKAFIAREREKEQNSQAKADFIETSVAKTILEIIRKCHIKGKIGVIFGSAGLGKTTAIKEYVTKNPDVILVEADLSYTAKVLCSKIHKKLGFSGFGSIHDMHEDIIQKLANTGKVIIIDEAEHLPYRALDLIRRVYDRAGIGIILVGMPRLYYNLCGKKGEYEQLFTRVLYKVPLDLLNRSDVKEIVGNLIPENEGIWEVFYDYCKGNTRMLANLLEHSVERARSMNKALSPELIKKTAQLLYVEMYDNLK